MTFEEFLAECGSARSVLTADGTALLVGDYVIECRGLDSGITNYIADALRMVPQPPAEVVEWTPLNLPEEWTPTESDADAKR